MIGTRIRFHPDSHHCCITARPLKADSYPKMRLQTSQKIKTRILLILEALNNFSAGGDSGGTQLQIWCKGTLLQSTSIYWSGGFAIYTYKLNGLVFIKSIVGAGLVLGSQTAFSFILYTRDQERLCQSTTGLFNLKLGYAGYVTALLIAVVILCRTIESGSCPRWSVSWACGALPTIINLLQGCTIPWI